MTIELTARSRSTDASLRALADVAWVTRQLDLEHRVIGGQMVAIHTHLANVADRVPARETADADAGVPKTATAPDDLARFAAALAELGYVQTAGDRFSRDAGAVAIDVVLPALARRRRQNVTVGPITATEAGGLAYALGQPPVLATVDATLLDGSKLPTFEVRLPTMQAALTLKAFAWADRSERRDAIDVWRLLVAAAATGISPETWDGTVSLQGARTILRRDFSRVTGTGPVTATDDPAERAIIAVHTLRILGSAA
jgi:hypothetical protein